MRKFIFLIYIIFLIMIAGCLGDEPIFTYLEESSLKVIIKGTYASNSPQPWIGGGITADDSMLYSDTSGEPSRFMLDIAEIRMNSDRFANYREVYSESLDEQSNFFNGNGVSFSCDDVYPDKNYSNLKIFIRKMIFDNADRYAVDNSIWTFAGEAEVMFNEKITLGYDFNQRQIYTYYDYISEDDDDLDNKIFPYKVPIIEGFRFNRKNEYIIEIRFVIKNFIEKYEYLYSDDDEGVNFFAIADFLRDVHSGDKYQGGNLIGVARVYNPAETVSISGNAGAVGCYVVAIPADENISDYTITVPARPSGDYSGNSAAWDAYDAALEDIKIPPLATWSSAGTYILTNVPVGRSYKLYRSTNGHNAAEIPTNFFDPGVTITIDGTQSNITADL